MTQKRNRIVYKHIRDFDTLLLMSMPVPEAGCWIWLGNINHNGYGRLHIDGKDELAHRFALDVSGVAVKNVDVVLHKCDNTMCVNPAHLFIGTQCDNMKDMAKKGRSSKGESRYNAKLDESAVRNIRSSKESTFALSKMYDVSVSLINHVRNGTRWGHVV